MKRIVNEYLKHISLLITSMLLLSITTIGSQLQRGAGGLSRIPGRATTTTVNIPKRPLSTVPVTRTIFQVPPAEPVIPVLSPIGDESLSSLMKRQAAAKEPFLPILAERERAKNTYLKDAFDAVNYAKDAQRSELLAEQDDTNPTDKAKLIKKAQELNQQAIDLATAVVADAVKLTVLSKELNEAAKRNKNLTVLGLYAQQDAIFANVGKNVVLDHFQKEEKKGNKMAVDFLRNIEEITKQIETEKPREVLSTVWEDLLQRWIESILTGKKSMESGTKDTELFIKLIKEEVDEATHNKDVATTIELNAQQQTERAKELLHEAAKNPTDERLAKLADIVQKNAFAAQFKFRLMVTQLKELIAKKDGRATDIYNSLMVGKKELLAKKAAEEQTKIAEKAAKEKAEREAKAAQDAQQKAAAEQQKVTPAPVQETWASWFRKILGRPVSKEAGTQALQ